MRGDHEIDQAARQLANYRQKDELPHILEQYASLIEDYKRLKSDYEEEREAREKYKQIAKSGERNPFVVVLVDGDGYVFHENLVSNGDEGGSRAAQLLTKRVMDSLERKGLERCEVILRIYANVTGLSKALHKVGLVGGEKRSLSPFIAGFNRSYGLADFVDAGELKENADFKLRALFRLYATNTQCKHIYFAACHDVGYVSDMTPHRGYKDKFTLVKTPGVKFHEEFAKLDMNMEDFPDVFRSSPLDHSVYRPSISIFSTTRATAGALQSSLSSKTLFGNSPTASPDGSSSVCRFYPQGKCKYGKSCKNLHIDHAPSGSLKEPSRSNNHVEGNDSNQRGCVAPPLDWFSLRKLPTREDVPDGHIPVNDSNFRLDPYTPPVSQDAVSRLKQRVDRRRVCNNFHLNGSCDAGDSCDYDHDPLDEDCKRALEGLARSTPCPKRGACRNIQCTRGHICQIQDCLRRGGKGYCRLPVSSHQADLALHRCVPADNSIPSRSVSSPIDSASYSTNGDDAYAPSEADKGDEEDIPSSTRGTTTNSTSIQHPTG